MVFSTTGYPWYLFSTTLNNIDPVLGRILPASHPQVADLTGKTAIVTGANIGIGLEVARAFASMGGTVIMACRSQSRGDAAREQMLTASEGSISPHKVQVEIMDVGDFDSMQDFITRWGDKPLDILVNNAGVTLGTYSKTKQGLKLSYVTNILSQYFLTLSLLPFMRADARIVNVSSVGSYGYKSQFDVSDLDHSRHIETKLGLKVGDDFPSGLAFELYQRQKLLQIYFTREMQQRLEKSKKYGKMGISVHCYHPGLVKSTIWSRDDGLKLSWQTWLTRYVNALGVSTTEGAATAVYLATDKYYVPDNSGLYWYRMGLRGANRLVEDEKARASVWDRMAVEANLREDLKL